ncbi:hypothetical protein R1sor_010362 [Riccia sorocarpa]|uniref:RING-type domain-containing protein n=1 Tax=Riccia sorocarpa TaxID=122646 RepID=A0ABD3HZ82_9MARC
MSSCPFARLTVKDAERPAEKVVNSEVKSKQNGSEAVEKERVDEESDSQALKCPYGYDSGSFKIGPLSCVICRALLYNTCRCIPCDHIFCRECITKYQDCVLCGADIQGVKPDDELQKMVDRFIEGHARVKRSVKTDGESADVESPRSNMVSYEDVSLARGSFLIQHAMRAFQAQNFVSAKSRLTLCAQDTREELSRSGMTVDVCSQLGAVLGMLGDCCRAMGDADDAMAHYDESVEMLSKLSQKDDEVIHALSVSLNKLGDLKYYAQDLAAAHQYYLRALKLRQNAADLSKLSSQVLDVAVSLAKVADVNRAMGSEDAGREGFQEAIKLLERFSSPKGEDSALEKKRLSILEFLHQQLAV